MPYTPVLRRTYAGSLYRHIPTGRTFICGGRLPGDPIEDIPAQLLILPALEGARDDLHTLDEADCGLIEAAPPKPRPRRRKWRNLQNREQHPRVSLDIPGPKSDIRLHKSAL